MVESAGLAGSVTMREPTVPNYQRVIISITSKIESGALQPGQQLPSTKDLSDEYGYSPGTIRKAVDILIDRGVLRGHQGLGVFVAGGSGNA